MEIFVGIDPSINSTGVTTLIYNEGELVKENFYVITGNKLTKKQQKANEDFLNFDYLQYQKREVKDAIDNHDLEDKKTHNFIDICDYIFGAVKCAANYYNVENLKIYIVQEGISYGSSMKTKSVYDLAGLNFMIRQKFLTSNTRIADNIRFIVATPSEIKKFASGNGNCNKETMIDLFETVHPEFVNTGIKIDDVGDSYFMAKYARKIYHIDYGN